jgi:hypothetical protein
MNYKITKSKRNARTTVQAKTKDLTQIGSKGVKWWKADTDKDLAQGLLSTMHYLKQNQQYRQRQFAIYARLYGNLSLFNFIGSNLNKMSMSNNIPLDRPTMNVVQSAIDTLTSQITQNRPRPVFQTDDADYKERNLAKQLNNFINGEFYQTDAYNIMEMIFRDAAVLGTGCIKIMEKEKRVFLERTLEAELLVDNNDGAYGNPRQLIQMQLVDRDVLIDMFPKYKAEIMSAESATLDSSMDSSETVADQLIVAEGWHLPSGKGAKDGRHTIACSSGIIFDEKEWKYSDPEDEEVCVEPKFPFIFFHFNPRMLGFWGQSASEQLMGTQIEINKMLQTASQSITMMATPRVWLEDSSKVVKAHINNNIGSIGMYRGTPPIFMPGSTGLSMEYYSHLQRLVEYAYQQIGVSQLSANGTKPAGLNSGEAQREYNDRQTDRFATLSRRYDNIAIELSYQIMEHAIEIAKRDGKYETVYLGENKTATKIELPKIGILTKNPFVIQCADASMLPRDPAGRKQEITEMMQSGMITMQEGRRLLNFPDLEQDNKLAIAGEERILKYLDEIIETGSYNPPDPMMDPMMAVQKATQYYNYYTARGLEESKAQKLRDFRQQALDLIQAAQPPPPPAAPGAQPGASPQAVPQPPPVSDMLPIAH